MKKGCFGNVSFLTLPTREDLDEVFPGGNEQKGEGFAAEWGENWEDSISL